jgi:hypothetical protein
MPGLQRRKKVQKVSHLRPGKTNADISASLTIHSRYSGHWTAEDRQTSRHSGQVVSTAALYSGGPGLDSEP